MKEQLKIMWIINGLGMGNSTRCHSVMDYLNSNKDIECIHSIITSGNGKKYFDALCTDDTNFIKDVSEISGTEYVLNKAGNIDALSTITGVGDQLKSFVEATKDINLKLTMFKPDIIVTDSTYYQIKKGNAVHVAINNADMIASEYKNNKRKRLIPKGVHSQFWCIEYPDYLYHKCKPDYIISPIFKDLLFDITKNKMNKSNIFHVSPFCRKDIYNYRNRSTKNKKNVNIVMMFTGSDCYSNESSNIFKVADEFLKGNENNIHIDIIGDVGLNVEGNNDKICFHGKVVDNISLIKRSDLCIINAGFSAIGEMHLSKKVYGIIPVDNHFEQYVNCKLSELYSTGISMNSLTIKSLNNLYERYKILKSNGSNKIGKFSLENGCNNFDKINGSSEAADIILNIFKLKCT